MLTAEKINGINIDPSQTPSGKLCRAPFSLHMKNEKEVDGVAIPLEVKELNDKNLIKKLKGYTPENIIKELDKLEKSYQKDNLCFTNVEYLNYFPY